MTVRALFTTSWDDGHPLDLRLAEMLGRYGLKGTFYIPSPESGLTTVTASEIRSLHEAGMEIGAHTMSHAVLTGLDSGRVRREVRDSKNWLENILGEPVHAFCYPLGKFNARVCSIVQECGFLIARTTVAFQSGRQFDPIRMPVSCQFMRHSRQIHLRHALREVNAGGLIRWLYQMRATDDLDTLCARMIRNAADSGGVFHPWGHSWEIEEHGLWPMLDHMLRLVAAEREFEPVTNSRLVEVGV